MKLTWVLAFVCALGAGILLYSLGKRDGAFSAEAAQRKAQREAAQDSARSWKDLQAQTVKTTTASAHARAPVTVVRVADTKAADSLAVRVAQLEAQLSGSLSGADSLPVLRVLVIDLRAENAKLRSALRAAEQEIALLARERNEWKTLADEAAPVIQGLEAALAREVEAGQCYVVKLLKIGCPSRLVVAVTTAVVTTVAVVVLKP